MSFKLICQTQANNICDLLVKEMELYQMEPAECDNCKKTKEQTENEGNQLKNCGKCKLIKYCSPDCQKNSWPVHKKSCKTFKESFETFNFDKEKNYYYIKGKDGYYHHKELNFRLYFHVPKSLNDKTQQVVKELVEKKLEVKLIPIKEE